MKWAKCNVGAEKETDYGYYFQWGSVTPNTPDECTWANAPFNGSNTRYNADAFNKVKDTVCPNGVLAKEYDAAAKIMGGDWRMPTQYEFQELLDNTDKLWTTINGVSGRKFTSKINGNSIFIPAVGECSDGEVYDVGYYGSVWSSSLNTSSPDSALRLNFDSAESSMHDDYRRNGMSVRGVRK